MKRGKTKSKTLKQAIALNEILMFILSSFAFAFMIAMSLNVVVAYTYTYTDEGLKKINTYIANPDYRVRKNTGTGIYYVANTRNNAMYWFDSNGNPVKSSTMTTTSFTGLTPVTSPIPVSSVSPATPAPPAATLPGAAATQPAKAVAPSADAPEIESPIFLIGDELPGAEDTKTWGAITDFMESGGTSVNQMTKTEKEAFSKIGINNDLDFINYYDNYHKYDAQTPAPQTGSAADEVAINAYKYQSDVANRAGTKEAYEKAYNDILDGTYDGGIDPDGIPWKYNSETGGYESFDVGKGMWIAESGKFVGDEVPYMNPFKKDATYTTGTMGAWGANIFEGIEWSVVVLTIMSTVGSLFTSESNKEEFMAIEKGLVAGIMTYKTIYGGFQAFESTASTASKAGQLKIPFTSWSVSTKMVSGIAAVAVGYLVYASQGKEKTKSQTIEFKCMLWQAPHGGSDCNECNNNPLAPCSEYRCKALGQTCKLINPGTGFDRCIDSSPNDVTSPGIKPWDDALTLGYSYTNVKERPPGSSVSGTSGMTITNPDSNDGCLKPFTPFSFGVITTDKGTSSGSSGSIVTQPAQCKIDFNHTSSIEEMGYYMGDNNLYIENHTQVMSLPGVDLLNTLYAGENGTLAVENDGEYTLYIRCMDGNGNANEDEFAVRFCMDKSPDVTPPVIKAVSLPTESPVLYQVDNLSISVYTDEPANCKWSRSDSSYDVMENNFSCSNNVWEMNAEFLYTCTTQLTSIKDREENNFYFKCQDLSERKNTMSQSYDYTLIGTQPLNILRVGPNGTIGSSTSTSVVNLSVSTDNGYKNGESTCYYSSSGNENSYIAMFETGTNIHKQSLDLTEGSYSYYFKCVDLGGNTAYNSTNFSIFVDKYSPAVIRVYNLESKVYIITDEESMCKYSTSSCNFDMSKEGISMPYDFDASKTHYAEWKTDQNYYIKCSDKYNNQPNPSECSIVIRPYQLSLED